MLKQTRTLLLLFLTLCSFGGLAQTKKLNKNEKKIRYYGESHPDGDKKSKAQGTVSNGTLINGKLMPFEGDNYQYFDTLSYLSGRAFAHHKVKKTVIHTYKQLALVVPKRNFTLMECSKQHGGKLFPHRTHQNGMSVDFMMPLLRNNQPYYKLDKIGTSHYLLEFDKQGKYVKDKSIEIDFTLVAKHILLLQQEALKQGLKIKKVIINTDLKDELFSGTSGQKLKASGIYIVQKLTPFINSLHDDHYHIDFEETK